VQALFGSLRAAYGTGASELSAGDAVRVACYERQGRGAPLAVELRLVTAGGFGQPSYLDPPAPVEAPWSAALAERLHAGIFRICSSGSGEYGLCSADAPRRLLQRRDPAAPAGWNATFPAAMLTAAAARDAPVPVRGFAVRHTFLALPLLTLTSPAAGPPDAPHRRRAGHRGAGRLRSGVC
jgi:hypothetical protein